MKNKRLFTTIISYIMIFILPFSVGMAIYSVAKNAISTEIGRVYDASANQFILLFEQQCSVVLSIMSEICRDEDVRTFTAYPSGMPVDELYELKRVQTILNEKTVMYKNDIDIDIYIYSINSGIALSPVTVYGDIALHRFCEIAGYESEEELAAGIAQVRYAESNFTGTEQKKVMTFMMPIRVSSRAIGAVFVQYSPASLIARMGNPPYLAGGAILLENAAGGCMAVGSAAVSPDDIPYREGVYEYEGYRVASIESGSPLWSYVLVTPSSAYLSEVNKIRGIVTLYAAISVAAGSVMIIISVHHSYSPVKRLLRMFPGDAGQQTARGDEYTRIEQGLAELQGLYERADKKLERIEGDAKKNLLRRLLQGEFADGADVPRDLGIDPGHAFAVVSLSISDRGVFYGQQDDSLLLFTVMNLLRDLCSDDFLFTEDGSRAALLVSNTSSGDRFCDRAFEALTSLAETLAEHFQAGIAAGISREGSGINEAGARYREAEHARSVIELTSGEGVRAYSEPGDYLSSDSFIPGDDRSFFESIVSGNFEGARAILSEVFERELSPEIYSVSAIKSRIIGIGNIVAGAFYETDREFAESSRIAARLAEAKSVAELRSTADEILAGYTAQYDTKKHGAVQNRVDEIIAYIDQNFTKSELSGTAIADRFGISAPYLSTIFKNHTGKNLPDYINRRRIDRACALLRNEHLTVDEIAAIVGYGNRVSFSRAFKKYEGLPPGEYRSKQMQHKATAD